MGFPKAIAVAVAVLSISASSQGSWFKPDEKPESVKTLKDVVDTSQSTGTVPKADAFYVVLSAKPSGDLKVLSKSCISKSFLAFARKFFGIKSTASVALTAKITARNKVGPTLTIPLFLSSYSEGKGECPTALFSGPLTFAQPVTMNTGYILDLSFQFTEKLDSDTATRLVSASNDLMGLIGASVSVPATLASVFADKKIASLAGYIDSQVSAHFSSTTDFKLFSVEIAVPSTLDKPTDKIVYMMPGLKADSGGVAVDAWGSGGMLYLSYSGEIYKSLGKWKDLPSIMATTIVNTEAQSGYTLMDIVNLGKGTGNFDMNTLTNAKDVSSLSDACKKMKTFLAGIMIPSDALVARYALLQNTAYDYNDNLREGSGCFRGDELATLKGYRAEFEFPDRDRTARQARDAEARVAPIRRLLATGVGAAIQRSVTDDFSLIVAPDVRGTDPYLTGAAAVENLAAMRLRLSCTQAPPDADLSMIAALTAIGGKPYGVTLEFDASGKKLASMKVMDVDATATGLGFKKETWLNEAGACLH